MSPIARPSLPPRPPTHPGLAAMVRAINAMTGQLETQRQTDATLAVSIATMSRQLERNGALELGALPPVIRRAFENLTYTSLSMLRTQPPETQLQVLRAMFMTAWVVSEAYELEGLDDAVPPAPET